MIYPACRVQRIGSFTGCIFAAPETWAFGEKERSDARAEKRCIQRCLHHRKQGYPKKQSRKASPEELLTPIARPSVWKNGSAASES
jgi:hypothetical protein